MIDRVKARLLPPSEKLKPDEVVGLLNYMFDWDADDMSDICSKLFQHFKRMEETPIAQEIPPEIINFAVMFKRLKEYTLHMTTKEASGYGQLNLYLLCIRDCLEVKHQISLRIDMQYVIQGLGKTDAGLLLKVTDHEQIPVCVIEYKPQVAVDLADINHTCWSELFLQAFYLDNTNIDEIVHVLTDLQDFHCFKMKHGKITEYFYFKTNLYEPPEFFNHCTNMCLKLKEAIAVITN